MKKLSVIIVNYNVSHFLEQALVSVFTALQDVESEVFVVDNNSVDNSVAVVQRRFPEVQLIVNKENIGFAKANNQAIRKATGEYILLLNPDTLVEEDTFLKCSAFMDAHPEAGGLGVQMLDGNGNYLPESKRGFPLPLVSFYKIFGLTYLFPEFKLFGQYYLGHLDKNITQEIEVLAGAFMWLRRDTLEKTGYLDEAFFMYGEDIDLSYRIRQAGYKNYYLPETRIIHYKGESTRKGSLNYVFLFYQAMSIFAQKHFSGRQARLFSVFIQVAIILRAAISITRRFVFNIFPFVLDAILVIGGMYLLQNIWERTLKPEPGLFPDTFMKVAVPAYTIIWILCTYLTGVYDKPVKLFKILRGVFIGTIIISAVSNFTDAYRFSKALILLGAGWATIAIWLRIGLFNLVKTGKFWNASSTQKRVAVVGNEPEYNRVAKLLTAAGVKVNLLGFLGGNISNQIQPEKYLGEISNLNEISRIYKIEEIIFSGTDLTAGQIMEWMVQLNNHDLQYKILPEGSEYIIGSNSKNAPGDYYGLQIELNLLKPTYIRQQIILNLGLGILFLLLSPIIIWPIQHKKNFLKNCLLVITRQANWVGLKYTIYQIKQIKYILTPTDLYINPQLTPESEQKIEVLYAKDYSVLSDLKIIWRCFSRLGQPVK